MIEITGKHGSAKIFTNNIEEQAISQLYKILNSEVAIGANLRIMPDCHAGAGCVIGTTMKITDKVIPNFVGVDISCGVLVQQIKDTHIELEKLDKVIHRNVPSGFAINNKPHRWANDCRIGELKCKDFVNLKRAYLSISSLGGGNHFISIEKDDNNCHYLIIHTGSRNMGKQIAECYQQAAYDLMTSKREISDELIKKLKKEGREKDIKTELSKIQIIQVEKSMAYCSGQLMDDYLHDMAIAQEYASLNRKAIADTIQCGMRWKVEDEFETLHNYIEMDTMILRKGAVSAKKGERLIIPINMQAGSIIATGKGNEDYNYSAPHGAGRLMSRKGAKESLSMDDFRESMKGIYTTCVMKDTLDESPMAYKPMQEIIDNIGDTVDIVKIVKPVYNFKASEEDDRKKRK